MSEGSKRQDKTRKRMGSAGLQMRLQFKYIRKVLTNNMTIKSYRNIIYILASKRTKRDLNEKAQLIYLSPPPLFLFLSLFPFPFSLSPLHLHTVQHLSRVLLNFCNLSLPSQPKSEFWSFLLVQLSGQFQIPFLRLSI